MRKIASFFKNCWFILLLLVLAGAGDLLLTRWAPVERSDLFVKNDYEKAVLSHGGGVEYEKVFYGNSVAISSFLEEESGSGFLNFGIDYGTVTDLDGMLRRGLLVPTQELVISLNYFVLLDTIDTNPTYPWRRSALEPYLYFQRDRISQFLTAGLQSILDGGPFVTRRYGDLSRSLYYGVLSDEELDKKIQVYIDRYWGLDEGYYAKNLAALESVADWCAGRGVRLRVVLMPWNGYVDMPEIPGRVTADAAARMEARGVEVLDLTDALPRDCFHDLGHLNYEHGAGVFTEMIDKWL